MPDPIITNNATSGLIMANPVFDDETLTFLGADTVAIGTILARKAVDTAIANGVADGGNTGDGTVTVCSVAAGSVIPLVGAYVLTNIESIANGGVWKLVDPNGAQVATGLTQTVGAGGATIIEAGGLLFTITDGATDFALADFFTLTVVADGTLTPYVIAGAGGAQVPHSLLTVAQVETGAATPPVRAMIKGTVRRAQLIIHADGDGSNLTDAIVDQLRDMGIVALTTTQLAKLDNQ